MKLYYTPGTSSLFPHIVLHEAGLAFEKIKVDVRARLSKWPPSDANEPEPNQSVETLFRQRAFSSAYGSAPIS